MEVGVAPVEGSASTKLRYRQLVDPALNEPLKENCYTVVKIAKTVGEFCGKIASCKEQTASQIASLVDTYRKKTAEIRKRPECQSNTLLTAWDQILTEVENEGKQMSELAQCLQKTIAIPLFQTANKEKLVIKKTFGCREMSQHVAIKAEESLNKKYKDYSDSWYKYSSHSKDTLKDRHFAQYHNCHNSYVLQLSAVNSINETLYSNIVPELIDDLQASHYNLTDSLLNYMQGFAKAQQESLTKLMDCMGNIVIACRAIDHLKDINSFVKAVEKDADTKQPVKHFVLPKVAKEFKEEPKDLTYLDPSLVVDDKTEPVLKRRCAYTRKQINSIESNMASQTLPTPESQPEITTPTTPGETFEEILVRRKHEIRSMKSRLEMHRAQHQLFTPSVLERLGPVTEEYADDLEDIASEETNDLQNTKTTLSSARSEKEKPHRFLDQNFMKPALCYYCKGIIVGLLKQGCRCQWCKMCVHKKCRANVPFCTGTPTLTTSKSGTITQREDTISPNYESTDSMDLDPSVELKIKASLDNSHDDEWDSEDDYDMPFEEGSLQKKAAPVVITNKDRPPVAVPPAASANNKNTAPPSSKPPLPRRPPELFKTSTDDLNLCVALFEFEAVQDVDLSLKAGERVQVLNTDDVDWWEGLVGDKKGYFPASYVQPIKPDDHILRCLYDFSAEDGDEMSLEQGQIIIEVENEGNGWIVGRIQGKQGAFPASYVEEVKPA